MTPITYRNLLDLLDSLTPLIFVHEGERVGWRVDWAADEIKLCVYDEDGVTYEFTVTPDCAIETDSRSSIWITDETGVTFRMTAYAEATSLPSFGPPAPRCTHCGIAITRSDPNRDGECDDCWELTLRTKGHDCFTPEEWGAAFVSGETALMYEEWRECHIEAALAAKAKRHHLHGDPATPINSEA